MTYPNPQPSPAILLEGIALNAVMVKLCPNQYRHVSAFPGYGRMKCPVCGKTYIAKGNSKC